jgi:putative DNA primase/helicase
MSARFMRQDSFDFVPVLKLWINGNHQPELCNVGEAMRRRIKMIPFTVTFPEDKKDLGLLSYLLANELPGILRWMINGCILWQEARSLKSPEAVKTATKEYFEDQDDLGKWLDERCAEDVNAWTSASTLFVDWCSWARAANAESGSKKSFSQAISKRGLKPGKNSKGDTRGFKGLALKPKETEDNGGW